MIKKESGEISLSARGCYLCSLDHTRHSLAKFDPATTDCGRDTGQHEDQRKTSKCSRRTSDHDCLGPENAAEAELRRLTDPVLARLGGRPDANHDGDDGDINLKGEG